MGDRGLADATSVMLSHLSDDRVIRRIEELAGIGGLPEGGMYRLPFSPEDRAARSLYQSWAGALGLEQSVDGAGNLVVRLEGSNPDAAPVMTGSHLDTQPWGGRYDGIVGSIASLEILEAMMAAGYTPTRSVEAVVWAGEEGSGRFDLGLIGSRAMIGQLSNSQLSVECHFTGRALGDLMTESGIDLDRLPQAERPLGSIASVVELHIEQGPFLEEQSRSIGVVTAIAGNWRLPLRITGQQSHSGATPMPRRRDALCAAAEVILAAERVTRQARPEAVATSGFFTHHPKVMAIVPGKADMTMDVRSPDPEALNSAKDAILEQAAQICRRRRVELEVGDLWGVQPTQTDPTVAAVIEGVARRIGLEPVRMPSWAGHDSMMLGKRFPAGVIFIPSAGGISHAPEEHTKPEDIAVGIRVLAETVAELAESDR